MIKEIHHGLLTPMCYIGIAVMLVGNAAFIIHPFIAICVISTCMVYIGAARSLEFFTTIKSSIMNNSKEALTVTMQEAWSFPIYGSCVLLGIYLVMKYFGAVQVNFVLVIYFSYLGAIAMKNLIHAVLLKYEAFQKYENVFVLKERTIFKQKIAITLLDLIAFLIGLPITIIYAITKNWLTNNILALAFALFGLQKFYLGKYKTGAVMLGGLFLYDIFWVFRTDVMVSVAKRIEAPMLIKLKRFDPTPEKEYFMLGLGDIIVPGVFISLLLRFEIMKYIQSRKEAMIAQGADPKTVSLNDLIPDSLSELSTPIFMTTVLGYFVGMITTISIMAIFSAAQPALLYLVPICLICSITAALFTKNFKKLMKFDEEEEAKVIYAEFKKKDK